MYKQYKIDALPADLLNDDFIQIFQPIFIIQRILGLLRVNIKYRYPTSPSTAYIFYSHGLWIVITVCIIDYLLNNSCRSSYSSSYVDSTLKFGIIMNGANGILIVWSNNAHKKNTISQLYVKLQKIERCLNMKNTKRPNELLSSVSIVITTTTCILYLGWLILFNILFVKKICLASTITLLFGVGIYMEVAQVFLIICFIIIRLNYIINLLEQIAPVINKSSNISSNNQAIFTFSHNAEDTSEKLSSQVMCGMHCILDVLSDFTEHYQLSIFIFTCQVLAWNLISVKNYISSLKDQVIMDFWLIMCIAPILLFMAVITLSLCSKAQALSSKLERSKKLCIDLTSLQTDGRFRQHAKQIILLVEGRSSLSIYNIYTLGTRLPLHLLAITASYTIVLFQFALL